MFRAVFFSGFFASVATAAVSMGSLQPDSPTHKAFALSLPIDESTSGRASSPVHLMGRTSGQTSTRSDDGLFYITAQVNGRPVRFMIDTGSNIVVLTASDAARIGNGKVGPDGGTMQTAGGMARIRNATIDRIVIAGQTLEDVDAVTVDGGLSVSLLGQSALSRLQSISVSGNRINLN